MVSKHSKVDTIFQYIDKDDGIPFIAFFQETWLKPSVDYQYNPHPLIPEGYATLLSTRPDPQGQRAGRGLMIVVHPELITLLTPKKGPHANLTLIDHVTTVSFEVLAAQMGPIFLASIYIKHTQHHPHYEQLMEVLLDLCSRECTHMILGGDFNYSHLWPRCHDLFQEKLGVTSVVTKEASIKCTHKHGNVLDHLLISEGFGIESVVADRMPEHLTDHYLLTLTLTLTSKENPNKGSTPNPNPNPSVLVHSSQCLDRFPISKLKKHRRDLQTVKLQRQRKANDASYVVTPQMKAFQERVLAREAQIKEGVVKLIEEHHEDLEAFNRGLLGVGIAAFGRSSAKRRIQRPYMYKSRVRRKQQARREIEKQLHRAHLRHRQQDIETATAALVKAEREWEASRRAAQREQWDDFIAKVTRGDLSPFYAMFQRMRMSKPPRTPTTHLDPVKTVDFFSSLYADPEAAAAIIASLPAYDEEEEEEEEAATRVTLEEIKDACEQTRVSCSGDDGVPPELIKHCLRNIKGELARLFTKCLRDGLPAGLRHGLTTLLPKTVPPSKDPAKYRPITLLPAVVRLLLRVVDNKLRIFIYKHLGIPVEQGGFVPNRNTHLQGFLLLLQRDFARHKKEALYIAFLDVEKAFDAIDHLQLLEILRKIGIPEALINAIHRLLPYFNLEVMGVLFPQQQGTFQGSPLSPLLCVLFLVDLILYINGDEASVFHGVRVPWDGSSKVMNDMIKLLLFADDIAALASSIEQLQLALDLLAFWAEKRSLKWGHSKCKVMRLSRKPSDRMRREELPEVKLQGHVLDWVAEFKYLGLITVEAPEYRRRLALHLPTDKDKVRPLCFALLRMFPSTARCTRVAPLAARLGVLQVIHAKFLYPTPLLDIDYDVLDRQTNRCLRSLCGLPLCSPSALLHADLGVWPSRYYAHQRALTFLYRLRAQYWTSEAFQQWYEDSPGETPKCLSSEWASRGVLARFGRLLKEYGLSWEQLRPKECSEEGWKQRVSKAIQASFERECKKAAAKHRHPWLEYPQPTKKPRIHQCLQLGGDLALAALRMRCPRLRLVPSFQPQDHGKCRFCADGPENGAHLIVCPAIPPRLRSSRDSILVAIATQARVPMTATRRGKQAIQDYVMNFSWPNMTIDLLKRLLVFCRNLINQYADFVPVWEPPDMVAFPVRRVRPVYRKPSNNV
jgi:hypothetical protein